MICYVRDCQSRLPNRVAKCRTRFSLTLSLPTTPEVSFSHSARQVIQRLHIRIQHPKARTRRIILQRIPKGVHLPEALARNLPPERLRIIHTRHRRPLVRATHRPPGLREPDPAALAEAADEVDGGPEDAVRVADVGGLEVRIRVQAEEVARGDDGRVGAVGPRGPGVDVADFDAASAETPHHAADVVDLGGQGAGVGVAAVEVFAPDGDGDDPGRAVLLDCLEEGLFFRGVVRGVFGPDADEERGGGGDGGGDGVGQRVAVGGGVEAGGVEGAGEGRHCGAVEGCIVSGGLR